MGVGLVLRYAHLVTQGINARVRRHRVAVVMALQVAKEQADGHSVLQGVVPVGGVVQRPALIDDAHGRLLGGEFDMVDLIQAPDHLVVQLNRTLHRSLGMELHREGDLEQDVLHHIAAEGAGQLEGLTLEQHIIEAPAWRAQGAGIAHLTVAGHECQAHGPGGGVSRRPGFAPAGVGGVSVGAQCAAVGPGVGQRVGDGRFVATQHPSGNGGRGDLHQDYMVDAHPVEAVLQGHDSLDLVGLDHGPQHISPGQPLLALAVQIVGTGQDGA